MKLVEIKNSLAKLYYEPIDFPLVISDFLTIDDGNQKILAQVVSIESTTKEDTNCAILKFALDLDDANKHSTYSGYVPALDAIVSRTKTNILHDIFSSCENAINVGVLTNSSKIDLNLNPEILDKFLYVQSDKQEEITNFLNTVIEHNREENRKTLAIKFHDTEPYSSDSTVVFGKDLKLPVNNDILNYIYENDLTGLTVEQKAIVQDILLEIEEYINTLEDGFIPFNTLLDVVNSVYESDKSTGVILFRNKLLKYNQLNIFASTTEEINALYDSLKSSTITVLDLSNHDENWTKEALKFALQNIDEKFSLVMQIDDDLADESHINELYANEEIMPVVASGYESNLASKIKSYAKDLVLFKPEKQQKAAASYNSFLMKLAPSEFIVSGETTYYTPLIVKELPAKFTRANITQTLAAQPSAFDETANVPEDVELLQPDEDINKQVPDDDLQINTDSQDSFEYFEETDELQDLGALEDTEENSEIKNIFDETVEEEIAKDVDKMFTAAPVQPEALQEDDTEDLTDLGSLSDNDIDTDNSIDFESDNEVNLQELSQEDEQQPEEDEIISADDLDVLEQFSDSDDLSLQEDGYESIEPLEEHIQEAAADDSQGGVLQLQENAEAEEHLSGDAGLISDDETLDEIEPLDALDDFADADSGVLGEGSGPSLELQQQEPTQDEIYESLTENNSLPGVPIYSTQQPNSPTAKSSDGMNITEGNIVYHEKYGRGVVEELFNYGKRTLCSIQFDNVGRRLLEPNLAELKQM